MTKHIFLEFKHRCAHKLNESESLNNYFNCDMLSEENCFNLEHTQPTQVPPPGDFGKSLQRSRPSSPSSFRSIIEPFRALFSPSYYSLLSVERS